MPAVQSLPDTPFPSTTTKPSSNKVQLSHPMTPALIADDEGEAGQESDDEWEHVGMLDEESEIVVVGELELDEPPKAQIKNKNKASYAAVACS